MIRLAVIFLLLLAGTEIVLRLWVLTPSRQTFDTELGFTYQANQDILHTGEGRARTTLNSLGLNAPPLDLIHAAAQNQPTVLVLGDSYTEALQVPRDKNFVSLAAQASGLNLVNAGRSGLGPLHYPAMLAQLKTDIAPDALIICLTQGDIRDARRTPYHIVRAEGGLAISGLSITASTNNRLRGYIEPLIHHSALATLIMRRAALVLGGWQWPWEDWPFLDTAQTSRSSGPAGDDDVYSAIMFQLATLNSQIPTALLYIPTFRYAAGGVMIETAQSRRDRRAFETMAAELPLPLIQAGAAMRASYGRDNFPLTGFQNATLGHGHLNESGHAAIAQALVLAAREVVERP